MTKEEQIKGIAYRAWSAAANAHRLYPDNKHTFTEYWNRANGQFDEFLPPNNHTKQLLVEALERITENKRVDYEHEYRGHHVVSMDIIKSELTKIIEQL